MSMNSKEYLKSYGWVEGEPLRRGGLKKPILVKHKKDTKGLGHGSDQVEAWWERLFDGQLKGLEVRSGNSEDGLSFEQTEVKPSSVSKSVSPLYRMFVRGEGLKGTYEEIPKAQEAVVVVGKRKRDDDENRKVKKEKKNKSKSESSDKKKSKSDKEKGKKDNKKKYQKNQKGKKVKKEKSDSNRKDNPEKKSKKSDKKKLKD